MRLWFKVFALLPLDWETVSLAFSLYLDIIRFTAALAVLLSHFTSEPFTAHVIPGALGNYGNIAVTIFFVLSGYVISFVTSTREQTASQYSLARIARLYSVIPLALLLTFGLDSIGSAIDPYFYAIPQILMKPESFAGYASSLLFVSEFQIFGFDGIVPGTNNPLWSLSFEATYYLLAGLLLFAPRRISFPSSILILAMAGRTITALLPVWIIGFYTYRFVPRSTLPRLVLIMGMAATMLGILEGHRILRHITDDNFGIVFPWGRGPFNRDLLLDYGVTCLFSAHLIFARQFCERIAVPHARMKAFARWLGDMTFPLYATHYPIICLFAAISPWPNTTYANAAFIFVSLVLIVAVFAAISERLKDTLRSRPWAPHAQRASVR